MRINSLNYIVLFSLLVIASKVNSQNFTITSSKAFFDPEYLIDGDINTFTSVADIEDDLDCSIAYINLAFEGVNYIKTITIDIFECIGRDLFLSTSVGRFPYVVEKNIAMLDEPIGKFTFEVNDYATSIFIGSDEFPPPIGGYYGCGTFEISELTIEGEYHKKSLSYDLAGNNISRSTIITPASLKSAVDPEPEIFQLDNLIFLNLYPNPTSGLLNFVIKNSDENSASEVEVKLYDIRGSLLIQESYNLNEFTIDITDKNNGTYLLNIIVNGKSEHFKIIKK